jgi:hypothetical protein
LATLAVVSLAYRPRGVRCAPRALTIQDYYKIKSVGDSQIFAGRGVAFAVSASRGDNTTAIGRSWCPPMDPWRGASRTGAGRRTPRWTDDGMLQFRSARSEQRFSSAAAPQPRPA